MKSGASYLGADFRFDPPNFHDILEKPSISIIGTGKRVGKTAVSAYVCRVLDKASFMPLVVAMGRGGPSKPEVILGREVELSPSFLLNASRMGKHAASDHYEDALMARVTTIGCRRCGGGMVGSPFMSNVLDGARLANTLEGEFVILEGSGSVFPPIDTEARVVVVGTHQPIEYIKGFFGPYRILMSDIVVLTMCEEPLSSLEKVSFIEKVIKDIKPQVEVIRTVFRPLPLSSIENKRAFFATTASPQAAPLLMGYLEERYGCKIVGHSSSLSNRADLRRDLAGLSGRYDTVLTELKAASVDVVTDFSLTAGKEVVYLDNEPITLEGYRPLNEATIALAERAKADFKSKGS
ncbi:MAG: 2,3-diphosphoglycerate synthetase [Actinomycetota bacterium]|nr:2,3-diphosphoglycerate synthetase [Actinomycetota bacterium]